LTATALNNVAVAFVIAGFVGPMVAVGYGSAAMARDGIAILVSMAFHRVHSTFHSEVDLEGPETMTLLEAYVYFGIPVIAVAMGFGALWMSRRESRQRHAR